MTLTVTAHIWRQRDPNTPGRLHTYVVNDANPHWSLVEFLDVINDQLLRDGKRPIAFESDCREGICGCCGVVVNHKAHGQTNNTPTCHQRLGQQLHRGALTIEPMSTDTFPVICDLIVDRSALDNITQAGGYIPTDVGHAPDADSVRITHDQALTALDYAACIGCGACVAACPNGAAQLYVGAKLAHLAALPAGTVNARHRAAQMTRRATDLFGECSLYGECLLVCPADIDLVALASPARQRLFARR